MKHFQISERMWNGFVGSLFIIGACNCCALLGIDCRKWFEHVPITYLNKYLFAYRRRMLCFICMKYACVHVHMVIVVVWLCLDLNVQLNSVFVNAWWMRANRTAYDNTDCQSEDEQKEEPVVERRRSSLSELGSKLTSLILPLKTLVQPSTHH